MADHLYSLYQRFPSVSTDTRHIKPGSLFFALKGESFNGNRFAGDALANGAEYAIIDDCEYLLNERCILVEDTLQALQELALRHRQHLRIPVIGLTGTNGKTTTKELIRSVLTQKYQVLATRGNLNNHIGVPLTLLEINPDTEIAIIEMGANHPGEIEFLCRIAQPTHGLITNVGLAHLEGFGSFEGVKKTKGELYQYLYTTGGQLFIQGDNPYLQEMSRQYFGGSFPPPQAVTYGLSGDNQVIGQELASNPYLSLGWKDSKHGGEESVQTHLAGTYNLENVLAAIALGLHFNLTAEKINKGISSYIPSNNRSQIIDTPRGNRIIGDYYNANVSSMSAALENFDRIQTDKHKVIILGDMFELGDVSPQEHLRIIGQAQATSAAKIIFIGQHFYDQRTKVKVASEGESKQTLFCSRLEEAKAIIHRKPIENALILLKGSRGMALEGLLGLL